MRDSYSVTKKAVALAAAAYNADNTPVAVAMAGFQAALLDISVGAGGITFSGTNKVEFKLTHSDDGVTYVAVTDADVILADGETVGAGGIVKALTAAHAAAAVYKVGYVGGKAFTQLLADFSGTHGTATPMAATWSLSEPAVAPV
jgi:hypothetical protein